MLQFQQKADPVNVPATVVAETLTLTFEERRRCRLRVQLDDGREAALLLPRGTVLKEGELLQDGEAAVLVRIVAAKETLSVVRSDDLHRLARVAYHLGNRHVALQIDAHTLAYPHDHVLDGLVEELGLRVEVEKRAFEPEPGGYGQAHGQAHGHAQGNGHAHD